MPRFAQHKTTLDSSFVICTICWNRFFILLGTSEVHQPFIFAPPPQWAQNGKYGNKFKIFSENYRLIVVGGLLEAYWEGASNGRRKFQKSNFSGVWAQITIFGHLGPKTHFLRYLELKLLPDSG